MSEEKSECVDKMKTDYLFSQRQQKISNHLKCLLLQEKDSLQ